MVALLIGVGMFLGSSVGSTVQKHSGVKLPLGVCE